MSSRLKTKPAIALLITVFFIMLITVSLGVALKYVKESSDSVRDESLTLQSAMVLEDFLRILKTHPALNEVKDKDSLAIFLAQSSLLPFQIDGAQVLVQISSASAKINPNIFRDGAKMEVFKSFLLNNGVNVEYADMLGDLINGVKEGNLYNTDIFNDEPYLFRDYVSSHGHLLKLNEIYKKKYHDNGVDKIDVKELFTTGKDANGSIDVNYATPLAWQLMLSCDVERAVLLSEGGFGAYSSVADLHLSDEENSSLSMFNPVTYSPMIEVKIRVNKREQTVFISFKYNVESKKGSNFVFEV